MVTRKEAIKEINSLVSRNIPFLFLTHFEATHGLVIPLHELAQHSIFYVIGDETNLTSSEVPKQTFEFQKFPVDFNTYTKAFQKVQEHIRRGDSFLLNLTMPTRIETNLTLFELFRISKARFKLIVGNEFLVFSPESFVTIENRIIKTFPMKGTINADIPHAREILLNDEKEKAEHATVVDLLRNDLSTVSTNVEVKRYRYFDLLETNQGRLFQVSSEITGLLPPNYREHLGEIIFSLLPAGSVTGAPKEKTLSIIKEAEVVQRGFYTGIFGVWDTKTLHSAVMIRFIRNDGKNLWFHSGGGITHQSDCRKEYNEMIEKVYVPLS